MADGESQVGDLQGDKRADNVYGRNLEYPTTSSFLKQSCWTLSGHISATPATPGLVKNNMWAAIESRAAKLVHTIGLSLLRW